MHALAITHKSLTIGIKIKNRGNIDGMPLKTLKHKNVTAINRRTVIKYILFVYWKHASINS